MEAPLPAGSPYYQTGQTEREVTLNAGETTEPVTFLNARHCSVSGTKFIDSDGSGTITGNDSTYSLGLQITLTGTTLGGTTITPVTLTTDANGNYSFTGLEAGHYMVTESPPATMTPIIGPSLSVDLVPGQDLADIDFLNSNKVAVSPEGPITPETPTSLESIGPVNSSPTSSTEVEPTSAETLPQTGINQLPLLCIAASLMLMGILLLVLGVFRRRKLA
jgi:SdrD B-like domain/LPXTG cell wall anchor motif